VRTWKVISVIALLLFTCLGPSSVEARVQLKRRQNNRNCAATIWPRPHVLELATRAWKCGRASGQFHSPLLTVIDYSLPSTEKRLWVLDLVRKRVLFHEFVAHGKNTGETVAVEFSNRPGSFQSSLGVFRTEEAYLGRHGLALRLSGLEPGFNDNARERAIVLHGASYVNPRFIARRGRPGRSRGCPAVDPAVNSQIIERIKNGTALFIYYPDDDWLRSSDFLSCPSVKPGKTRRQS